jgi:putative spermidine/putrescine transport system permease protein
MNGLGLRIALGATVGLILGFLILPIFAVVPAAFNHQSFIRLPPTLWSLRWVDRFLADPQWFAALADSIRIGFFATLLSVVIGTAAALGLDRLTGRLRAFVMGLFVAPLIVPVVVLAVALYAVFRPFGLIGTTLGLVLAHAVVALPFVVINVGVSLKALDPRLTLAAEGLGASPWRRFRTITLPLILPGVASGAAFAFITSFDEVVLSVFLAGPQVKTLPVRMWEVIRLEYTPIVAVAATAMILMALALGLLARMAERR